MKKLSVRLPEDLIIQIEREARRRRVSKSQIVRERLSPGRSRDQPSSSLGIIEQVIGSVDGLPADLSTRKKHYLKLWGYGRIK
jgi:hypothetical protein